MHNKRAGPVSCTTMQKKLLLMVWEVMTTEGPGGFYVIKSDKDRKEKIFPTKRQRVQPIGLNYILFTLKKSHRMFCLCHQVPK